MKKINVLSLFDGISCGQVALERAGIEINKYYASEIDKYAIEVAQKNYPNTIQLGDVTKWQEWKINWASIDLLIGGSPCQGFSFAGKQLNFNDPRSKLFFVYVDILNHIKKYNPNVKFLLENVKMKKEYQDVISSYLGVEPIEINSALVSAQNRKRLYWANFKFNIDNFPNQGKVIKDILEDNPDKKYYMNYPIILKVQSDKNILNQVGDIPKNYLNDNERQRRVYSINSISPSVLARSDSPKILCVGFLDMKASKQIRSVYNPLGLSPTVDTMQGGHRQIKILDNALIRKLTPLECERLQTLDDNYTEGISNTQRYKCIGNGWTVDVITHIFKGLKESEENQ